MFASTSVNGGTTFTSKSGARVAEAGLLVRNDAAVSVGEASLPVLRKGSGQAAAPTFTLDRRVAVGHSLPCIGVGYFTTYLPHSFVLVAGLAACGLI